MNKPQPLTLYTKRYELTDWLGNVRVVITNKKTPLQSAPLRYKPDVVSVTDYYAFGSEVRERSYEKSNYEYGFNGQIEDNEITGIYGSHLAFEYRIYDSRLGKFLSVDPLMNSYPWNSTYAFAENRVIDGVDLEGIEYVTRRHYIDTKNKTVITKDIIYFTMTDQQIIKIGGEPRGQLNSAPHGSEGRGIRHEYYIDGTLSFSRWDNKRNYDPSLHGLYSGPGCITDYKGNYDWQWTPIDISDQIAKLHDINYFLLANKNYWGYIDDTRTLSADITMVKQVSDLLNSGIKLNIETKIALIGQVAFINLLAEYKTWKIGVLNELGYNPNNPDEFMNVTILNQDFRKRFENEFGSIKTKLLMAAYPQDAKNKYAEKQNENN